MNNQAKKIVEATKDLCIRPQSGDREKLIVAVVNEIINQYSSSLPPDSDMDEFYARMYGGESVIYVDDLLSLISELQHE